MEKKGEEGMAQGKLPLGPDTQSISVEPLRNGLTILQCSAVQCKAPIPVHDSGPWRSSTAVQRWLSLGFGCQIFLEF